MNDTPGPAPATSRPAAAERQHALTSLAVTVGMVLTAVGVILGLVMALRRREARCPDGTLFPAGETDHRCFVHPEALQGSAVVVVSLLLGILVLLVGSLVLAGLRRSAAAAT